MVCDASKSLIYRAFLFLGLLSLVFLVGFCLYVAGRGGSLDEHDMRGARPIYYRVPQNFYKISTFHYNTKSHHVKRCI